MPAACRATGLAAESSAASLRLSSTALTATMIEESDISSADHSGAQHDAEARVEHARRDRDRQHVVDAAQTRFCFILRTVALESVIAAQDVERVAPHQHHLRRLDRHIRPRADGDADVGLGQRRRVVDAVADHRHALAFGLQLLHVAAPCRAGSTSAKTRAMPSSRATASAVRRLSPVIIAASMPAR